MAHRPRFVDRSPQVPSRRAVRGGALLRSGEAGVGKSVLLDTAAYWVVVAGIPLRSYRAAAEFVAGISFSACTRLSPVPGTDVPVTARGADVGHT
jgi:hypothetical protein